MEKDPCCQAPFVAEAVIKIAINLEEKMDIPLNGTVLIIGSIIQVEINASWAGRDGFVALSEAEILISQGLDAYFIAKEIGRLAYARP